MCRRGVEGSRRPAAEVNGPRADRHATDQFSSGDHENRETRWKQSGFGRPWTHPDMRRGPSKYEFEGPRTRPPAAPGRPGHEHGLRVPPQPLIRARESRALHERMARPAGPAGPLQWHPQPGGSPLPDGPTFSVRAALPPAPAPGCPGACTVREDVRRLIRALRQRAQGFSATNLCAQLHAQDRPQPPVLRPQVVPTPVHKTRGQPHALPLINPLLPGARKRRIGQCERGVRR
jgi:hypothetical protein